MTGYHLESRCGGRQTEDFASNAPGNVGPNVAKHGVNEWLYLEHEAMLLFLLSVMKLLSESQKAIFLVGTSTKSSELGVQC